MSALRLTSQASAEGNFLPRQSRKQGVIYFPGFLGEKPNHSSRKPLLKGILRPVCTLDSRPQQEVAIKMASKVSGQEVKAMYFLSKMDITFFLLILKVMCVFFFKAFLKV